MVTLGGSTMGLLLRVGRSLPDPVRATASWENRPTLRLTTREGGLHSRPEHSPFDLGRHVTPSPSSHSAYLLLEDGRAFPGTSLGAVGLALGEVVFNTSMSGYQEILTDPSYSGQLVTMTYPLIGNYGVNSEDRESERPQVAGFVVREASRVYSSWRGEGGLHDYLAAHGVVGIAGVDTRALTRHIRAEGAMRGAIAPGSHPRRR